MSLGPNIIVFRSLKMTKLRSKEREIQLERASIIASIVGKNGHWPANRGTAARRSSCWLVNTRSDNERDVAWLPRAEINRRALHNARPQEETMVPLGGGEFNLLVPTSSHFSIFSMCHFGTIIQNRTCDTILLCEKCENDFSRASNVIKRILRS